MGFLYDCDYLLLFCLRKRSKYAVEGMKQRCRSEQEVYSIEPACRINWALEGI